MGLKGLWKRRENEILASVLLALLLLFIGIRYDYYYAMNDDVTMKDVLSGVYTGTPEGHNIQMLYPLSAVLSLLYRLFPDAPVYGMFLCLCQFGSLWMVVNRSLRFGRNPWMKAGLAVTEGVLAAALLLPHLVFVQYTFTSGMLAAAAAFLFLVPKTEEGTMCLRDSIPSVLLAVLSYLLRTEMLLLLLPLICVAGMYRWSLEAKIFTVGNAAKYLTVIGAVLAGMLAAWAVNAAAFSSAGWKEYTAFFNSRTELYDFQGIPPYEGNGELYGSLGITENGQAMLLEQYNFGLDEGLSAGDLDTIAEYQAERKREAQTFPSLLAETLRVYRYRIFHQEPAGSGIPDDYPWNLMALAGYAAVAGVMAGSAIKKKRYRRLAAGAGKLAFLFCVRTALWMFILVRGRDPERITHALYLMEIVILFAMLHTEAAALGEKRAGNGKNGRFRAGNIVLLVTSVLVFVNVVSDRNSIADTDLEYRARAVADTVDGGMKEYCRNHGGNFYFMDVYSAVSYPLEPYASTYYAEKMFRDVDNRLGNYDLMGGWLVKSPTHRKKMEVFGMTSMQEALLHQENVYLMAELAKGTEGFEAYFAEQGTGAGVKLKLVDTVCDIIGVYQVVPAGE